MQMPGGKNMSIKSLTWNMYARSVGHLLQILLFHDSLSLFDAFGCQIIQMLYN